MARLTVEECLNLIPNRYDLVLLASKRTRQLALGADALVDEQGDKPTVIALREIEAGLVTISNIDSMGRPPAEDSLTTMGFPPLPEPREDRD
ncbi:MAG: DNA-directed RNA polymerase subunit omega [Gammaproteobacteria bacterium]|nr:DNA-directed RNA polymerase subunit omega [Gammaproteobacteria bacterium]